MPLDLLKESGAGRHSRRLDVLEARRRGLVHYCLHTLWFAHGLVGDILDVDVLVVCHFALSLIVVLRSRPRCRKVVKYQALVNATSYRQARERAEGGAVLTAVMEEGVGGGWRALANVAAREAGSLGASGTGIAHKTTTWL